MKKKVLRYCDYNDLIEYKKLIENNPCKNCTWTVPDTCQICSSKLDRLEYLETIKSSKFRRLEYIYVSDIDVRNLIDAEYEYLIADVKARQANYNVMKCRSKVIIDLTCDLDDIIGSLEYIGDDYKEESK